MAKNSYPYDECRAMRMPGHDFRLIDRRKGSFGFYYVEMCTRCTTTVTKVLNHRGERIATWYKYPADYKDPRALSVADYRAEVLSKAKLPRIDKTVQELLAQRSAALREALQA